MGVLNFDRTKATSSIKHKTKGMGTEMFKEIV